MKKQAAQKKTITEEPAFLRGYFPLLIISLISFLVYVRTLWYDFSPMDERWLIFSQQERLSHFSNFPDLFKDSLMGMYYRPLCIGSFMLDMVLGDGSAFVFHLSNILLHVLCCVLLFRFFIQLNISKSIAFFSALIFAVHPMNVHAVAWVPGRNDTLLCLFSLLSCLLLLKYIRNNKIIYLFLHVVVFALALFTKENAIVLPAIFFLLWFIFGKEKKIRDIIPAAIVWLAIGIAWFFIRKNVIDYLPGVASGSFLNSILNFLKAFTIYIGKVFVPIQQSVMPVLRDMSVLPFLIVSISVIAVILKFGLRNKKTALFGLTWFVVFLIIPVWVGSTDTNGDQYEHRVYIPLIGALIFLSNLNISIRPIVARRLALLIILIFAAKTVVRSSVYKDKYSFAEAGTIESPSVHFFHDMLGFKYYEQKKYQSAIVSYSEAIRLDPTRMEYYNHRGNAYFDSKNYKLALVDFNKTLQVKGDEGNTLLSRSMANFYLGNRVQARTDLENARKLGAGDYVSKQYIADLFNALQHDTINMYTERIVLDSQDVVAYNRRGIAWMHLNKYKEAIEDFDRALLISPASEAIIYNRDLAIKRLNGNKNR